jgi:hypothetical protein
MRYVHCAAIASLYSSAQQVVGNQREVMAWSSVFTDMCGATNFSKQTQSSDSVTTVLCHKENFINLLDDVNIVDLDTGESVLPQNSYHQRNNAQRRCDQAWQADAVRGYLHPLCLWGNCARGGLVHPAHAERET